MTKPLIKNCFFTCTRKSHLGSPLQRPVPRQGLERIIHSYPHYRFLGRSLSLVGGHVFIQIPRCQSLAVHQEGDLEVVEAVEALARVELWGVFLP